MRIDSINRMDQAPEALHQDLEECADLADEAIKELRTISYLLHPPMLDEVGLKSAIVWYLEGFTARSGIKTTLSVSSDLKRLSRDFELAVFRVLQESLTNVHRHSGSKTADVSLSLQDNMAVLEVTDQGSGMLIGSLAESDPRSFGVGIRGMKERLGMLGGTLDLSSTDRGTKVVATVPLENPNVLELLKPRARD
jgi:two-component system NarL family sensor kinase